MSVYDEFGMWGRTDKLTEYLRKQGIPVPTYHGRPIIWDVHTLPYKEPLMWEAMREDWLKYFMDIVGVVQSKSDCISRKNGTVIVHNRQILSTGYNGAPSGYVNCNEGGCRRCDNKQIESGQMLHECICVHAEINAITQAAKHGVSIDHAFMFTEWSPCMDCAKAIIQAGIKQVYFTGEYPAPGAIELMSTTGIRIYQYTTHTPLKEVTK